ncbi:MAG TPA: RNA polymerase subunit sigma-70 [Clostridia bacterium]|nr:RNA polymerase subunit sigma-70 [Clostridia bacterium]
MPVKGRKKTQEYLSCELYALIENDLQNQLIRMGSESPYALDLVHDYMEFWVTKCLLEDDIRTRGVMVIYNNGGGQKGRKKNDSVELKIKVTQQMTAILDKLNIKTISAVPNDNAGHSNGNGEDDEGP